MREVIQQTQFDVETALIDLERFEKQLISKRNVLSTAVTEENILTVQWRIIGGDDSRVGIKLENLLDAQQRRTDAEKDLVKVESAYMIALVQLQRAMGTLLINEGVRPVQSECSGEINFLHNDYQPTVIAPSIEAGDQTQTEPEAPQSSPLDLSGLDGSQRATSNRELTPTRIPFTQAAASPTPSLAEATEDSSRNDRESAHQPTGNVAVPRRIGRPTATPASTPIQQPPPQPQPQPMPRADWRTPSAGWTQ
ncbi:MAG: hypothetical protein F9B45_12030 [Phycisphaera sp. RhM]|nr:hypothetical protein [Phycisphaera sp. RhM]